MIPKTLAPRVPVWFNDELKLIDKNLEILFNQSRERFEVFRYSQGRWHWILSVEDEDGGFRPLDRRTLWKLREMDIVARYGSVANYDRAMDEKLRKWRETQDKVDNHETCCDIKDDRKLWKEAAENFRSGIINDPPPRERDKKAFSYPKGEM